MKIVVDMNHPGHVHYFRNFIDIMKKDGNEVLITASSKDITIDLLNKYKYDYVNLGSYGNSLLKKFFNIFIMDYKLYKSVKKFNPDVFIGFGSIRAAHVSFLLRKKCINFDDTEHSMEQKILYLPFINKICTPECYNKDLGHKQVRFNGYIELCHLHPNYFKPDSSVLKELGLSSNEDYILLRFVSWNATHDMGQHGVTDKVSMVKELEKYGRVVISSEGNICEELKPYELKISPEKIHHVLYYAKLYVGEGATMATEAALLGTPSIYISSLAKTMGNFKELEEKYDAVYLYADQNQALEKAIELLRLSNLKDKWQEKRNKILNEKIDVTDFITSLVKTM